jgi:hypothetical protein
MFAPASMAVEPHRHLHVGEHIVGDVGAAAAGLADLGLQARGRQQQGDLEVGRGLRERMTQRQGRAEQRGAGKRRLAESAAGELDLVGHGGFPDFLAGL